MDKEDIIAELDKLKLKIMVSAGCKTPSELDKYNEWINKLLLREKSSNPKWYWEYGIGSNEKYVTFALLKSCVGELYGVRHANEYEYQRSKPEIRRLIAEIISMVLFYQDELNKK